MQSHQEKPNEAQQGKLIWSDDFDMESKDSWKPLNGKWTFAEGKLIVEFAGMASDAGVIVCSPVDSRAQFLSSGHPPLRDASIVITDARASWHIDGLDFGSYAICAYHDAKSNSELDTDGSVFRTKITVFPTRPAALLVHLTT